MPPSPEVRSGLTENQRQQNKSRFHALKLVVDGQLASEIQQKNIVLPELRRRLGSDKATFNQSMLIPERVMEEARQAIRAEQARRLEAREAPTVEVTEEYVDRQLPETAKSPQELLAARRVALADVQKLELEPIERTEVPTAIEIDAAFDQVQQTAAADMTPAAPASPRKRLQDAFARRDPFKDSLNRSA